MLCVLLADVEVLQRKFEHLSGDEVLFLTGGPRKKDPVLEAVGALMDVYGDFFVVRVPAEVASIPLAKIAKRSRIPSDGRYGKIEPNERDMAPILNILGIQKRSLEPALAR